MVLDRCIDRRCQHLLVVGRVDLSDRFEGEDPGRCAVDRLDHVNPFRAAANSSREGYRGRAVADDRSVTGAGREPEALLEEIDNPIERLKLLSGNDEEIAKYLEAIEVTSPREREMLQEIARTRPLARPDLFPQAHRNMVEALESLARHGYKGTTAGTSAGPFRPVIRWFVQLVARYLVVSHIRNASTQLRNLYGLREIQSLPGTEERYMLRRARMD